MLQFEILIWKCTAVDAMSTGAISPFKVATLKHQIGFDGVKSRIFVAESIFMDTQRPEILDSFGHNIISQFYSDSAQKLAISGNLKGAFLQICSKN